MTRAPSKQFRSVAALAFAAAGLAVPTASADGGDQYRPGFGWGDPSHNHAGPPVLSRAGGERAAPIKARKTRDGRAAIVSTRFRISEQATLWISVVGPGGVRLLLTQDGSRVGRSLDGNQTKTIRYRVLVPRTIPLQLRIPSNLLAAGKTYLIRIRAVDPSGKTKTLVIPFRA